MFFGDFGVVQNGWFTFSYEWIVSLFAGLVAVKTNYGFCIENIENPRNPLYFVVLKLQICVSVAAGKNCNETNSSLLWNLWVFIKKMHK